jgi:polysaccharide biosynthesis transport protein
VSVFVEDREGPARYLQALRDHWLLIVTFVAVAVAAAVAYSVLATPRYEASADILVTPVQASDDTFIGINVLRKSGLEARSVLTAAHLLQTTQVAEAAKRRLHSSASPEALLGSITVTPQSQTNILTVVGKADSADAAAATANAFAHALLHQRSGIFQHDVRSVVGRLEELLAAIPSSQRSFGQAAAIEQRLAALRPLVGAPDPTLQITSPALPPSAPAWPRPVLSVAVALLAALVLGIGAALALDLISPRVTSEDELLLEHRLPILTRVPRMPKRVVRGYLSGSRPLPGAVREAYRTLRASLATAGTGGRFPATILITSATPGEGKTMTAVNLANTLALGDLRVILVDGDLRRPMVSTMLGIAGRHRGFADLVGQGATVEDVLVPATGSDQLWVVPASPEHAHLVDLLDVERVEAAVAQLRLHADVVVIDSPPLTEVADALSLADAAEAVVVAVRLGRTRRDRLVELRRMFGRRGISPVGFVVTTTRRPRQGAYYGSSDSDLAPLEAESRPPRDARTEPRVGVADREQDF